MKPKTQFKIETLDEFEKAKQIYKDRWLNNIYDKELVLRIGWNYIVCDNDGIIGLSQGSSEFKTIPSPLPKQITMEQLKEKTRHEQLMCRLNKWSDIHGKADIIENRKRKVRIKTYAYIKFKQVLKELSYTTIEHTDEVLPF